jgi:hypothetical protein
MKIGLTLIGLIFSISILAQDIPRNNVFAEVSGVTGIYSVNYERLLLEKRNFNWAIRGGFAYVSENINFANIYYNSRTLFPISISMIKQISNNNYLEIRIGSSNSLYMYEDWSGKGLGDSTNNFVPDKKLRFGTKPSIGIGYRYQPIANGIFFNFLVQKIALNNEDNLYPYISLGIGYAF